MAVRFNKRFNINRVVKKLVYTILALYVGGTILSTFGTVMNCTSSPFYTGLSLIGWTITSSNTPITSGMCNATTWSGVSDIANTYNNQITAVSGSGVLAVVGIIAIAQIVTEFVTW
ncbi:hypothetical protein GF336_07750 [Candidatus Woesearchaeota archaeon]|nr:hypothetical protein [Candidatus Woesearchaeota archaeon]